MAVASTPRRRSTDAALGHEAASLRATVSPPPATALTARFEKMPASHKGPGSRFSFELHFSAELAHLSYRSVAGPLFTVTNGAVTGARQLTANDNSGWQVDVEALEVRGRDRDAAGNDVLQCGARGVHGG